MSCMILTHNHINFVVNVIAHRHESIWCGHLTYRATDLDSLGAALVELNAKAYASRYPDASPVVSERFRYVPLMRASDVAAYKALIALHYQLCEDVTFQHQMTQQIECDAKSLACQIVQALPAYQAEPWGIE